MLSKGISKVGRVSSLRMTMENKTIQAVKNLQNFVDFLPLVYLISNLAFRTFPFLTAHVRFHQIALILYPHQVHSSLWHQDRI